jgi:disulfide bond formation protein DsbB
MTITRTLDWALDHAALLVLAVSAAVLVTVFAMQYLGDLAPCPLCINQRWPYGVAVVLSAMALAPGATAGGRRLLIALCAVAFVIGDGYAIYHAGVEQGWFAGPTACSGAPAPAGTIEALRQQLMATPVVRCDEIPWSLFGISLAGFNVFASAGLVVFCIAAAARTGGGRGA